MSAENEQTFSQMPWRSFLKRLAVRLFRFTICICLLVIIMIEAIFLYLAFDDAGYCLEHGGIWDGNKKLCRYDCLAWSKETGCVPLDKPEVWFDHHAPEKLSKH